MGSRGSSPEEAITKEEIQGEDGPRQAKRPRNAFTELMSTKPRAKADEGSSVGAQAPKTIFRDRMGLGAYLEDPASHPASRVIYHTDDFVTIHDKFPKATVHTLLLPRSVAVNLRHPFDALADPAFLASVRAEVAKLKVLVAKELRRKLGPGSRADAAREAVLDGRAGDESEVLPPGRDWEREVVCGVHAVPSMSHLHVHVLSRDMHSQAMKHRKHYNSFKTPFLVDIDDFPLAADDPRRDTKKERYLEWDLKCWRCGQNFGNQFKRLKEHLEIEFRKWRAE